MADQLRAELFAQDEEARLGGQMEEAIRREKEEHLAERARLSQVATKFEEVARVRREMDVDRLNAEAADLERRILSDELLESVAMYPDHLEVMVSGVPRSNVTLAEVGLTGGWQSCGVGGPTTPSPGRPAVSATTSGCVSWPGARSCKGPSVAS